MFIPNQLALFPQISISRRDHIMTDYGTRLDIQSLNDLFDAAEIKALNYLCKRSLKKK